MIRGLGTVVIAVFCLLPLPATAQQPGAGEDGSIVDQWRDVLRYGIDAEVLKVIKAIDEAEERSLDQELVGLFRQSLSTEVRTAILALFATHEIRAAEEPAVSLLSREELEDPVLQTALIRYLAAIDSAAVEAPLLRLIEQGDQSVADERVLESALLAVGQVGSPAAGALLLEKLRDLGYPDSLKPEIILALGELRYEPAVEELIGITTDRDAERTWRMYAATALGEIGDPRAIPPLKELFREQDSLVRTYAASAMAHFGMGEVEELLQQGLRDSNERVRATAARALANPQATASVEILIYKARNDPAKGVRTEAIRALGQIAAPAALRFLRELYAEKLAALPYREEALLALCENDLPGSLSAIEKVIDTEWATRDQKVVGFTARILSTQESPGLAGLYGRFLTHPDVGVRIYALRGIGKNRLRTLRERVETLSQEDPHPAVRRAAAAALERL